MNDRRPDQVDQDVDHDAPPMLVLGEDRPDVEDTTAEELARQRAELEDRRRRLEDEDRRRRAEAEEAAQALRREAEEKLARERREAEIELARRQREIDDAERRLERNRRRLQKQSGGTAQATASRPTGRAGRSREKDEGNSLLAAVDRRSGMPVPKLGRASTLAVIAAALVALGAPLSIDPPPGEAVEEFVAQDEARIAWRETGLTLDRDVVDYLAGEDVAAGGEVPSVAQARGVAEVDDYYLDPFVEGVGPLLEEPGSTPQRVLSAWTDAREATGYSVSSYDVDRAAEALDTDRALPTWMLLGALVAVGGLAYGLFRGGTRVGAGVAGLGLVTAGILVADGDRHLDVEEPITQHAAAMDGSEDLYRQLERDLAVVLGTRSLESYEREDYWERTILLGEEVEPGVLEVYATARARLQDVDLRSLPVEESLPHSEALIEAGSAALDAQHEVVVQRRAEVVAHTEPDVDLGPYVTTAVAAGLLPLLALVPAVVRRQKVAA